MPPPQLTMFTCTPNSNNASSQKTDPGKSLFKLYRHCAIIDRKEAYARFTAQGGKTMAAPDPVAFTIFGVEIRWYGILLAAGYIIAIMISYYRAPKLGIDRERILDLAIWIIPSSIIGARAYYVIFEWQMYAQNPASIFDIRRGGLAIHGGLLAGLLAGYLVCRHYKTPFLRMADLIFPSVALAQAIGRWGNFFNSEAHGGPTGLPWAILVNGQKVHPTFLYESLWCLFLFFFLIWMTKKRKFDGQIFFLYCMMYSLERGLVEELRTDSLMIGPFKQAQVLSVIVFFLALSLYILFSRRAKNHPEGSDTGISGEDTAAITDEASGSDCADEDSEESEAVPAETCEAAVTPSEGEACESVSCTARDVSED